MGLFVESRAGGRDVRVTDPPTAGDGAPPVRHGVDDPRDAEAERITRVCATRKTPPRAALSPAFEPAAALRRAKRRELVDTPTPGSGLNRAAPELSVLRRQGRDRRISGRDAVAREAAAWEERHNARQVGIDWQFTTENARIKLKHLYPKIKE